MARVQIYTALTVLLSALAFRADAALRPYLPPVASLFPQSPDAPLEPVDRP